MVIFKNFITTITRFKTASFLNIIGLAVAFASFYILMVQVHRDVSFNKSINRSDEVYMLQNVSWMDQSKYSIYLNRPMCEYSLPKLPEVESWALWAYWGKQTVFVKKGSAINSFDLNFGKCTDKLTDVFDIEILQGSTKTFNGSGSVILSESAAQKLGLGVNDIIYMGNEVKSENAYSIAAIFKDFADNSSLGGVELIRNMGAENLTSDSNWSYSVFMKIRKDTDMSNFHKSLQKRINSYASQKIEADIIQSGENPSAEEIARVKANFKIREVNINDLYFQTDSDYINRGNKTTTYALMFIAILLVLIALINYINFFFALIPVRIKSVNTYKIFGCGTVQLKMNFIFESLGLILIALLIASLIVYTVSGTYLASFISCPLKLSSDNMTVFLITIVSAIVIAFMASLYPAHYITSFPPAMIVKGSFGHSIHGKKLCTTLICIQFIISIIFIIATFFIELQRGYMLNYDIGFNKENLLVSYITPKIAATDVRYAYSAKLLQNPNIKAVSFAEGDIVSEERMGWGREYKGENIAFQCYPVQWDFLEFIGLEMKEGRYFMKSDEMDSTGVIIFNDAAKRMFNMNLGDKISTFENNATIVGFCENFNFKPLNFKSEAFAFVVDGAISWNLPQTLYIRGAKGADIEEIKEYVAKTDIEFDKNLTKDEIEVNFFDDVLGKNYEREKRLSVLITFFSFISIFISLVGVFGLVLFDTQYKRKEIAIRKVHGAKISEVLKLFNYKYIKIVIICFIVALPAGYYIVERWLSSFAYRVQMYWWVFAIAFLLVIAITGITVTARSWNAASENPADSIKE